MDGHLSCFHFFTLTNNAIVKACTYLLRYTSEFGGQEPRSGLQSTHIFTLPNCCPKWLHQFTLSPAEYASLLCSTSSQTLGIMRFLKFLPIWWTWKRDSKFVICMSYQDTHVYWLFDHLFFNFFFGFPIALWFYYSIFIGVKSRNSESRLPGFKFWLHHTHLVSEDTLLDLPFLFPHL